MPAGNDCVIHISEQILQLIEGDPLARLLCMVVVDIHDQNVGPEKVLNTPMISLVLCAHVIKAGCSFQSLSTCDLMPVRIAAVGLHAGASGCVDRKFHCATSFSKSKDLKSSYLPKRLSPDFFRPNPNNFSFSCR